MNQVTLNQNLVLPELTKLVLQDPRLNFAPKNLANLTNGQVVGFNMLQIAAL